MNSEPYSVVEGHRPCASCGYDLQGLPTSGDCPECGSLIALSLKDTSLCFADPRWVAGLARGTTIILAGIAGILLGAVLLSPLQALGDETRRFVTALTEVGITLTFLAGVWLLTRPDPANRPADDPKSRRLLRWAALVIWLLHASWGGVRMMDRAAALGMQAVAAIAGVVAFFAATFYGQYLAKRLPDATLGRRMRQARWAWSGIGVLIAIAAFPAAMGSTDAMLFLIVVGIWAAVAGVWTFGLFVTFHAGFRIAAKQAAQHWQQPDQEAEG